MAVRAASRLVLGAFGMTISIRLITDAAERSAHCAEITRKLPRWFGRPEANANYVRGMANRIVYASFIDEKVAGLIGLEFHFTTTCNVWWLGVDPAFHRRGIGRALLDRSIVEARTRGCLQMAVETMSPRANSPEYNLTRRFYQELAFVPFVEFEPSPGDYLMWMIRKL